MALKKLEPTLSDKFYGAAGGIMGVVAGLNSGHNLAESLGFANPPLGLVLGVVIGGVLGGIFYKATRDYFAVDGRNIYVETGNEKSSQPKQSLNSEGP